MRVLEFPCSVTVAVEEVQARLTVWDALRAIGVLLVTLLISLSIWAALLGILVVFVKRAHGQTVFPQDPSYTHYGPIWESPSGQWYQWDGKKWSPRKLRILAEPPKDTCPPDQHLHPKEMSPYIPDTFTGKKPVPDDRCHFNLTDEVAGKRAK